MGLLLGSTFIWACRMIPFMNRGVKFGDVARLSFGKLCRLMLFHEQRSQIGHVPRICRGGGLPIHVGLGILLAYVACRLVLLSFGGTLCFLRADSSKKKCLD